MKKILACLLLFGALCMFVSCPGLGNSGNSDSSGNSGNSDNSVTPPVDINAFYDFQIFTQGFWQNVNDESKYFWVKPDEIMVSENLNQSNGNQDNGIVRSDIEEYKVESRTYYIYVNNFTLDNSTMFNYTTIFSGDSSIKIIPETSVPYLYFFAPPETGYPFVSDNNGYRYYISVGSDNGWYRKVDDYTYNTISLEDIEGTYELNSTWLTHYTGSIVISNGEWHYYGDNDYPDASSGTVSLVGNDITFVWNTSSSSWDREATYKVSKDGSIVTFTPLDSYNQFFEMLFGYWSANSILTFEYSSDVSGNPSSGSGSGNLADYEGTYTFNNAGYNQSNGSISISGSSWSFESDRGHGITPGSVEMDGSNVRLYYTVTGMSFSDVFTVTINGSSATWRCIESSGDTSPQVSVLLSGIFSVVDLEMTFDY